ncbi:hypothetical protein [Candidatus Similichlamydia laticola]|nr:hypothetical protein [Candidatus Similichlamydia laticola]
MAAQKGSYLIIHDDHYFIQPTVPFIKKASQALKSHLQSMLFAKQG